ncbi:Domain of uncharacterised function (DUF2825) [Salmonella enterica subsp. arizonae]|nr:Domain of uncharacterised function (DUF2825) [Salmonella enterica subsp. arizonae]
MFSVSVFAQSRFIPAGAGNTEELYPRLKSLTVYPRWRGEHLMLMLMPKLNGGLSPLARGTLDGFEGIFQI